MINISIPYISLKNRRDVDAALVNASVSTYGAEVTDFENALTLNCKMKHAVAVNSGTSAFGDCFPSTAKRWAGVETK